MEGIEQTAEAYNLRDQLALIYVKAAEMKRPEILHSRIAALATRLSELTGESIEDIDWQAMQDAEVLTEQGAFGGPND